MLLQRSYPIVSDSRDGQCSFSLSEVYLVWAHQKPETWLAFQWGFDEDTQQLVN